MSGHFFFLNLTSGLCLFSPEAAGEIPEEGGGAQTKHHPKVQLIYIYLYIQNNGVKTEGK